MRETFKKHTIFVSPSGTGAMKGEIYNKDGEHTHTVFTLNDNPEVALKVAKNRITAIEGGFDKVEKMSEGLLNVIFGTNVLPPRTGSFESYNSVLGREKAKRRKKSSNARKTRKHNSRRGV